MTAAPLRILVVDDEPPIRKLLRMGLEHAGLRDPRGAERQDGARSCSSRSPIWSSSISACPIFKGLDLLRTIRARNERMPDRRAVEPRRRGRQGCRRSISAPTTT